MFTMPAQLANNLHIYTVLNCGRQNNHTQYGSIDIKHATGVYTQSKYSRTACNSYK